MELRQLRYFVRIVDLGSFSRAAGELFVAQSALSQQVAALEAEFAVTLLKRTPRGVTPTEAGLRLYRHARQLLLQAEDTRAALAHEASRVSGTVAIGLPLSLVDLGAPIVAAVRDRHPGITMQLHEAPSGTILEWIKNGRLAIGLAFDDGNLEGLEARRVLRERLYFVVPPRSPHASRESVSVAELRDVAWVLPGRPHGVRDRLERELARAGLPAATLLAEVNSQAVMRDLVQRGLGATVFSWHSVARDVTAGELVAVPFVEPTMQRVAALCVLASAPRGAATEAVLAAAVPAIGETVSEAPDWRGACLEPAPDAPA